MNTLKKRNRNKVFRRRTIHRRNKGGMFRRKPPSHNLTSLTEISQDVNFLNQRLQQALNTITQQQEEINRLKLQLEKANHILKQLPEASPIIKAELVPPRFILTPSQQQSSSPYIMGPSFSSRWGRRGSGRGRGR
jgi:hypothetical protein